MLLLSSADTAPASVAVLVTAVKIETLAVSAAGTAQFLALSQTSNAILLQQLLQCLLSLPRTRRLQLSLHLDRFSSLIVKRQKLEGIQASLGYSNIIIIIIIIIIGTAFSVSYQRMKCSIDVELWNIDVQLVRTYFSSILSTIFCDNMEKCLLQTYSIPWLMVMCMRCDIMTGTASIESLTSWFCVCHRECPNRSVILPVATSQPNQAALLHRYGYGLYGIGWVLQYMQSLVTMR